YGPVGIGSVPVVPEVPVPAPVGSMPPAPAVPVPTPVPVPVPTPVLTPVVSTLLPAPPDVLLPLPAPPDAAGGCLMTSPEQAAIATSPRIPPRNATSIKRERGIVIPPVETSALGPERRRCRRNHDAAFPF